jgi:hypothetical protein
MLENCMNFFEKLLDKKNILLILLVKVFTYWRRLVNIYIFDLYLFK